MKERVGDNIRSGMFWTFMERIGTKIVQFALQLLLARILVPEDYGLCALLLAFINIATVLVNSGLNTALIQKKNADSLDFSSVLYLSLGISIAIYVLLFFISPLIAEFFNDTRLCELMRVLSITLVVGAFNSVQLTVLYRKMQFRKLFIANLSGMIVSAVISIGLALMGWMQPSAPRKGPSVTRTRCPSANLRSSSPKYSSPVSPDEATSINTFISRSGMA